MSVRVASNFQGRWTCFWATSYSLELELFDEYLFRRLGDPPLNATLLVDFERLARSMSAIGAEDTRLLRRANRDYLLRGVGLGSGSFHPKTYFFGNPKEGVLLVGSGNLTLRGIEEGHELFARFESRNDDDLASIRGWRAWTDALVSRLDDRDISLRWLDLKDRCGEWLNGSIDGSSFVHNADRSMLEQLTERVSGATDELHVTAPFYDAGAGALKALCERLKPRRLYLYFGGGTSVEGNALARVLESSGAQVSIAAFEPSEFVHAKLIGIVQGEQGLLLSGSANLSHAALTGTQARSSESWANVEAGVLVTAPAALIRATFVPDKLELRDSTLADVALLSYSTHEERLALPVKLRAARLLSDGRVEVDADGATGADHFATAGLEAQRLREARTVAPLELPEGGALVWICDPAGAELSNRVPLDDPARLRDWLKERTGGGERPQGLDPLDYEKPVGRMLQFLHERCIFDIDETGAATRARRLANEESGEHEGSWDFLEELLKEELRLDPRVERYRTDTETGLPEDDEILGLLRLMLDRTPSERGLHAVGQPSDGDGDGKSGTLWTPERRLQVRLFNVLERWCGALNDPRFRWIDPSAPTRNFSALLVALYECWEQSYLPPARVEHLLETLYGSYVRTERGPGYLFSVEGEERFTALGRLPREARILGGALAYASLAPTQEWHQVIFVWQPFLIPALELGVVEIGNSTPALVRRLLTDTQKVTRGSIEERLLWACGYIDDEHWCLKQERELGLDDVALTREGFSPKFGITLAARTAALSDPQLVALVHRALVYRKVNGAVVEFDRGRLALHLGEPIHAVVSGATFSSPTVVDEERLAELERSGASFARILGIVTSVAS